MTQRQPYLLIALWFLFEPKRPWTNMIGLPSAAVSGSCSSYAMFTPLLSSVEEYPLLAYCLKGCCRRGRALRASMMVALSKDTREFPLAQCLRGCLALVYDLLERFNGSVWCSERSVYEWTLHFSSNFHRADQKLELKTASLCSPTFSLARPCLCEHIYAPFELLSSDHCTHPREKPSPCYEQTPTSSSQARPA